MNRFVESNMKQSADQGFLQDLNDAIRENPVSASLIGIGALWMFFGNAKIPLFGAGLSGASRTAAGAVGVAAEVGSSVGSQVAEHVRQAGDTISSGVQGAGKFVRESLAAGYEAATSDAVSEPVSKAAETVTAAAKSAAQFGIDRKTSLQENLRNTLEQQPLVLGAIGLAMGAAIASAFPTTGVESKFMGEAGSAAKQKIQEVASETSELVRTKTEQVLRDVKTEADAQGLTTSAATEALKSAANKIKVVAGSTGESARKRLS